MSAEIVFSGVDTTNSDYGEVTLSICHCATLWLQFFIEYGRLVGLADGIGAPVPSDRLSEVKAESTLRILNSLE